MNKFFQTLQDNLANFRQAVLARSTQRQRFSESLGGCRKATPGRAAVEDPTFFARRGVSRDPRRQNFPCRSFNLRRDFGVAFGACNSKPQRQSLRAIARLLPAWNFAAGVVHFVSLRGLPSFTLSGNKPLWRVRPWNKPKYILRSGALSACS